MKISHNVKSNKNRIYRVEKKLKSKFTNLDSKSIAAIVAKKQENKKLFYSLVSLCMKFVFLGIASISLVKIGYVMNERKGREIEINHILRYETQKLQKLSKRFDFLFSIDGEQRFMKEQDQLISPGVMRVIWQNK